MNFLLRLSGFFFSIVLLQCSPLKTEITDSETERLLDRLAQLRIHDAISSEEKFSQRTDWDRFQEVTKIYRLELTSSVIQVRKKNPLLADYLQLPSYE